MIDVNNIVHWSDQDATLLFGGVLAIALVGGWWHWHSRAAWNAQAPVPMLQRRVGLVVAAITSVVFGALSIAVKTDGRLLALDHDVANAAQVHIGAMTLQVLAIITHFGDTDVLVIAGAIATVLLLLCRQWLLAAAFPLSLIGNGLLIRIGKEHFRRMRPLHEHGPVIETSYSFPSGHAAGSLMFYGMLAYVLLVFVPARWHRLIIGTAVLVAALIGTSRILLQVHFFSDVCAGYALATGWLALCVSAIEFLRSSRLPKATDAAIN